MKPVLELGKSEVGRPCDFFRMTGVLGGAVFVDCAQTEMTSLRYGHCDSVLILGGCIRSDTMGRDSIFYSVYFVHFSFLFENAQLNRCLIKDYFLNKPWKL